MPEYIEKETLIDILNCKSDMAIGTPKMVFASVVKMVDVLPTVEVVRCKDCKHKCVTEEGEYNPEDIVCNYHMSDGFDANDFCSYGERLVT